MEKRKAVDLLMMVDRTDEEIVLLQEESLSYVEAVQGAIKKLESPDADFSDFCKWRKRNF